MKKINIFLGAILTPAIFSPLSSSIMLLTIALIGTKLSVVLLVLFELIFSTPSSPFKSSSFNKVKFIYILKYTHHIMIIRDWNN